MNISISEIANITQGKIFGDNNVSIKNVAKIQEAKKGDLTFLYHPSYEKYFETTGASAILVKQNFTKTRNDITYIEVQNPEKAFTEIILKFFLPEFPLTGIDKSAFIDPSAEIGENVSIGKNVVISAGCKINDDVKIFHNTVLLENVEVGSGTIIFQNVSIRENCKIGKKVIIHPNSVIGSDGFGYYNDKEKVFHKIPQIGNVIIEDDVEIGSNVSIDRASLGSTIIKRGVKIDNLVQIAHNVSIDEDSAIASQAGISGSTKIGKNCLIAGQVGIVGHIEITDNVILMAKSGISKSIKAPGSYFGYPAKELKTSLKLEAHIRNLPEYLERIQQLENKIKELEKKLEKKDT